MPAKNIVFIDSRVSGYQSLIDGLSQPAEVFILDGESDGLMQMAGYLKGPSGIEAINVVSHGSQGALYLGSTVPDSLPVRNDANGTLLSFSNGSDSAVMTLWQATLSSEVAMTLFPFSATTQAISDVGTSYFIDQ